MNSTNLSTLPQEIILAIIDYLESGDLILFSLLSKEWIKLLDHQDHLTTLLRLRLEVETRLDLTNYSRTQLNFLVQRRRNRIQIKTGYNHTLILDRQGQLHGFGDNDFGQLACPISSKKIKALAAGCDFSLILDQIGQVYSFGYNMYGQLGIVDARLSSTRGQSGLGEGSANTINQPTLIAHLPEIKTIAASPGGFFSLLLDYSGQVWSFGANNAGQLGHGDTYDRHRPASIIGLKEIIEISAGTTHSLVLDCQGQVYSFGTGNYGQLGQGKWVCRSSYPQILSSVEDIVSISAGNDHSLLLSRAGQVFSFGSNAHGQLGREVIYQGLPGLIERLSQIVAISAGSYHSLVLNNEGQVWGFGNNEYGQLGLGEMSCISFPTRIATNILDLESRFYHSLLLDRSGELKGRSTATSPSVPMGLWGCGSNEFGQLGITYRDEDEEGIKILRKVPLVL
jgi:alpha-tubulin suppressor-like RCC1 family protein